MILNKIRWLNSWENSIEHNIEIGLDNRAFLRGYTPTNILVSFDELPKEDFFIELEKNKPNLYSDNKFVRGEVICYINDEKYRVIYHYDKHSYMITDSDDNIIDNGIWGE